ncbi:protease inhibitor 2-like isoform X2 [Eriocheir sinensis]|uniref:protease inhibitor 2-like isoform X2 n=1 Tax=Eriocheir sinensis TaxID=95602 RepID=UPI0021C6A860|nr:protease inhibitor 2-like isoform X2 [Eriocheir sinensis]
MQSVTSATTFTALVTAIGLAGSGVGLQLSDGVGACLSHCATTTHYNPVCGSDYVTYTNPSTLLCWKKCRYPELSVAHFSSCIDWITGQNQV